MSIKSKIKSILPISILLLIKQIKLNYHKKLKYNKIEKEIDKKYYRIFGSHIDWNNPRTYSEKLNVSKVYGGNHKKTVLSDKYLVRNWVGEKIGNDYLIPLIGVYDKFDEINFDKLPNEFVIKCNHDSGSVTICNDKNNLKIRKLKKMYNFFLNRNYAYETFEFHYKDIEPKILIEKNMGSNIKDYKFLCFNGEPILCWVDVDRFENHKRAVYDMDWNKTSISILYDNDCVDITKPKKFEEMKRIVKILCSGFDHVRVDLYIIDNAIYFGEMTFTNGSGYEQIKPEEWNLKLGELWKSDNDFKK